jgi:acyl carrier protein
MGRDFSAREASRARGFQPVSVSRGLASLHVALRHQHVQLVIGLDAANRRMMPLTVGGVEPLRALAAYVEASRPVPPPDLPDRFGAAASCRVVELDCLPMTEEGEIDRDALRLGRPVAGGGFVPPRTKFERRIAELWQELLDVPRVGVGDNFFGLGGHSLLAAQLASRLQATLGVEVPVRMVFECPTLESLAESVLLRRMKTDAADHGAAVLAELERMPEDEALIRAARLAEGS